MPIHKNNINKNKDIRNLSKIKNIYKIKTSLINFILY